MEAHPRTQTGPRTLGRRNGRRIIGTCKPLFANTCRFAWSSLAPPDRSLGRTASQVNSSLPVAGPLDLEAGA